MPIIWLVMNGLIDSVKTLNSDTFHFKLMPVISLKNECTNISQELVTWHRPIEEHILSLDASCTDCHLMFCFYGNLLH